MESERFYTDLVGFDSFKELLHDIHFRRVPDNWHVIITDVKGSTAAIEKGKYRCVNTVGAASISVIKNLLQHDFPYVFGGDGATLLIPDKYLAEVLDQLHRLSHLSANTFDLHLRVGHVRINELTESVEVAKHRLVEGQYSAVLRGGGVKEAEQKIKARSYVVPGAVPSDMVLTGLSCRWKEIPSQNGNVVSLIIEAVDNDKYQEVLTYLENLFHGEIGNRNPVNTELMRYKSVKECLADERRYHSSSYSLSFLFRALEICAAVLIFKYRVPAILFNSSRYKDSMRTHADYRKFDGALRLTLDCTAAEQQQIVDYLNEQRSLNHLVYGLHTSNHSIMTCFVESVSSGRHVHFIDGGNGGYAKAAEGLKTQQQQETRLSATSH